MQYNEDGFNFEDDENILDASINLRINSKLKSDFEKLCKKNQYLLIILEQASIALL